jgi:hypothetical protein
MAAIAPVILLKPLVLTLRSLAVIPGLLSPLRYASVVGQ